MKGSRHIVVVVAATLLMTVVVMVACSAPENQNGGQANTAPQAGATDWKAVGQALGKEGSVQPGDVYKVSLPRNDLQVTAGSVQIKPGLALGGWVAFKQMGSQAMVMGDLVLTEDEVTPVMTKLQEGGVEQTALHNHVLTENPRLFFMHFWANDDAQKLARGLRAALDKVNIKKG